MSRYVRKVPGGLSILIAMLVFLAATPAFAATQYVPDNFSSIQAAIDGSLDGDTILIRPGTYFEHLTLVGRTLTLQSTDGPGITIIHGSDSDRVMTINGGTYVVNGLTLTHGFGYGGAIYIDAGSLSMDNCRIMENQGGTAGGIAIFGQYASASVSMSNCTLERNRALDGYAGAVFVCWHNARLTCTGCRFEDNSASWYGGAVYVPLGKAIISDSVFTGNSSGSVGGAIYAAMPYGYVSTERCIFSGNTATSGGAIYAGTQAGYSVYNSLFVGNSAINEGGAIATDGSNYTGTLSWVTVTGNSAPVGGGVYLPAGSIIRVGSSIVYGNSQPSVIAESNWVSTSDIEGGVAGTGNIDADPLFANAAAGDFTLAANSPCVDTGSFLFSWDLPSLDLAKTPRPQGPTSDMGAYEYDPDADGDGYKASQECNDADATINPGAAEIAYDGIDQNCDGFDLTIRITNATWSKSKRTVTIEATSSYGAQAALQLATYAQPMTWISRKGFWTATQTGVSSKPASLTVSGPEGSMSGPVTEIK